MTNQAWGIVIAAGAAFVGLAFACLTAVLAELSGDEVSGWLPVWSERLLESAVALLPPDYRGRYRREWRAELAAFDKRRLSGLRFAWRLRRKARSTHLALCEAEQVGVLFGSEPPPAEACPLDPEVIAAIVRRAVEKTRPSGQGRKDFMEVLAQSLAGLDVGDVPAEITRRYLVDVRDWREQEKGARKAEGRGWSFGDMPGLEGLSLRQIRRDAEDRQRASELRRRAYPRQRFPFSYWL